MAKVKKTPEQIYKRNKNWAKVFEILSPIVFWGFLALAIMCFVFAMKNSFGNVLEIVKMLDDKVNTGQQLEQNYQFLVNKWGEWTVGTGGAGFQIKFINIGKAVFSGLMVFNLTMSVIFLIGAFVLGKWILPMISKSITQHNQDMVNLTVLKGK